MNKILYINNKWTAGNGAPFTSYNPATNVPIWNGNEASSSDVNEAINGAYEAFPQWSKTPFNERQKKIQLFIDTLSNKKEKFARLISEETGKPLWESHTEVTAMIGKYNHTLTAIEDRCKSDEISMGQYRSITRFNPHGVLVVLGPFNLPGHLPNGHIIPALLMGNTIIFKPSEQTPRVGSFMIELWESAQLPSGVLQLVQGGKTTGEALISHDKIKGVLFTGSYSVGSAIHRHFAGRPEKILALEMGGNNPLIVWDTQAYSAAAYLTILSAFITSGQRCVCARRLIVPNNRDGAHFLDELQRMMKQIRMGTFTDNPEPFMGPLISENAATQLIYQEQEMVKNGAQSLIALSQNKAFVSPGLIDVTNQKSRIDGEHFGPLLQVIRVKTIDEAIAEANNTAYGLAGGLLSDSSALYEKVQREIQCGILNWNRQTTGAVSSAPFGGVGKSGNYRPSAAFAPDYCAYPTASLESSSLELPETLITGLSR